MIVRTGTWIAMSQLLREWMNRSEVICGGKAGEGISLPNA